MATKKANSLNPYQKLFDTAPYVVPSTFELNTFYATSSSAGFARRVIEVVNQVRELEATKPANDYEKQAIAAKSDKLKAWLENFDPDSLVTAVNNWEDKESNYWVDSLGKQAAIELVADNKISKEVMEKMAMLPELDYIKATQLCVRLANAIKAATVSAEESIGVFSGPQPAKAPEPVAEPVKPSKKIPGIKKQ
jgi:hypothetical protein